MKELEIEYIFFMEAFGRDPFYDYACSEEVYLNTATGQLLRIYQDPECAEANNGLDLDEHGQREQALEEHREDYVEIPPRSHEEHHHILRAFLNSDWTDDAARKEQVLGAYLSSIGKWIRDCDDRQAVSLYRRYRNEHIDRQAEAFLHQHGIEPVWK